MYTIICDQCGSDIFDGKEFSGWNDIGYVEDIGGYEGWAIDNNRHYCPKCYTRDDDHNLIIFGK